jgi:hypothetical protein
MADIKKGDVVTWNWGDGTAEGEISSVSFEKTSIQVEDSEITRNGTPDNPAIIIEQDDGARILKLLSEVSLK